ncbi:hypothetical protein [Sulfitobacter delicatus]|jgi:hypothetical protein|uniref:Uncharacterized protein n=1 Tax=Sulfitobacter delicatus TaxID=218672 RepID=A0A1G7NYP4_9RHOB|nr:hypothetical protein [Sulfitobacter delicatus]SDF79093.1 hypothetical protein SAMN04489759_103171 [Sulfitobacter delicatus]
MGQKRTKAIILKGRGDSLAYWKPTRSGRRAFRFDGMFTRETSLSFVRVAVPSANSNHAPADIAAVPVGDAALVFLHELLQRRGA